MLQGCVGGGWYFDHDQLQGRCAFGEGYKSKKQWDIKEGKNSEEKQGHSPHIVTSSTFFCLDLKKPDIYIYIYILSI